MSNDLPFSQTCENNKQPILQVLADVFTHPGIVLEIGTGTGQHAVFFASHLPHIKWLPSDHPDNVIQSAERIKQAQLENLSPPQILDVSKEPWPAEYVNGVFSANTAHIMAWLEVEAMFRGVARRLMDGAAFCLYGPFNYDGNYTSDSNRRFDEHLKQQAPKMGLRDISDLKDLGVNVGLILEQDHEMPANNRLLVWRRG